jgi:hypothetical protein
LQLLEAPVIVAHRGLLLGGQRAELLHALAHELLLLRRQRTPLLEALPRKITLLGRHGQPALTAALECGLAIGRQALPLTGIGAQQILLLGREIRPGHGLRGGRLGKRRQRKHQECRGEQGAQRFHLFCSPGGSAGLFAFATCAMSVRAR